METERLQHDTLHARYIDERPGSEGLFGPDPAAPPLLSEAMKAVGRAGVVWECVLSFKEGDAQALGLTEPGAMRDLARRMMPGVVGAMGIAETARWHGAVHHKRGQPHVHVQVYQPVGGPARPGHLTRHELRQVRRVIAREVYGPLRAEIAAARTAMRDLMLHSTRVALQRPVDRGREGTLLKAAGARLAPSEMPPTHWDRDALEDIGARVAALVPMMPGHGRAALAFMPEPVRAAARGLADDLLARPELQPALRVYCEASRAQAEQYVRQSDAVARAETRAMETLRDRVAQGVVQAAAALNRGAALTAWQRTMVGQQLAAGAWRALMAPARQAPRLGRRLRRLVERTAEEREEARTLERR